jgi:hypothetical protein
MAVPMSEWLATATLLRITLQPWEVDALVRLDGVWRTVMHDKNHTFDDLTESGDEEAW